jgi:hypothetical protein
MKWLAILLAITAILMLSGILILTLLVYRKRDDLELSPTKVYQSLLTDHTISTVSSSLSKPSVGDVGTFGSYDWPDSKVSGVGGGLQVNNPTNLSIVPSIVYIPQTEEGRPSIVGLT